MRISGVNGYVDVEVTPGGEIQLSATEYDKEKDRYGAMAVVRLSDMGCAALSTLLDTGTLEIEARTPSPPECSRWRDGLHCFTVDANGGSKSCKCGAHVLLRVVS